MQLHNRVSREELKQKLEKDQRPYTTISFYKYYPLPNPQLFRDHLYLLLQPIEVLGRIYVAKEGINAQISLPSVRFEEFKIALSQIVFLEKIRLNIAVEQGLSFIKLDIKVRPKIVADGLDDQSFNPSNTGQYLDALAWNQKMHEPNTVVIDMRNHYESEVGKFKNALTPDVDSFRDELQYVVKEYENEKDKNILMYCTGGIRCEKASAWMKHNGFSNVYHLEGGIINYVKQVKEQNLDNEFVGVNFVFDNRLAERISTDVIAQCHCCGKPADSHTNCANLGCHTLFIQCETCSKALEGCCSEECNAVIHLPEEEQKLWRKQKTPAPNFSKGRKVKWGGIQ